MEELKPYLLEEEEILWKRIENVNLLGIIQTGIIGISILLIFGILLLIFAFQDFIFGTLITLSLIIIGTLSSLYIIARTVMNRKKKLGLDYNQLKNYKFYNIITNKRIIRKDFYFIEYSDFSAYPKESIDILNYTLFFDLNFVEKVRIDTFYNKIYFLVRSKGIIASEIYLEFSQNEFTTIFKILTNLISLKEEDRDVDYIEYVRLMESD